MTMMTIEEGINQDLDDILADAGNPVFVCNEGNARKYRFPDGMKFLVTDEDENVGVIRGYVWLESLESEEHEWLNTNEEICWSCHKFTAQAPDGLCVYCV